MNSGEAWTPGLRDYAARELARFQQVWRFGFRADLPLKDDTAVTEADWRAFATLLRFDLVYYSHFKCNLRRIQDYRDLAEYLRELYQWPGIKETFDLEKIKAGYYTQRNINPSGIVPIGPAVTHLEQPHNRGPHVSI